MGSIEQVTDALGGYVEAGVDWLMLRLAAPFDYDELHLIASEVLPTFL